MLEKRRLVIRNKLASGMDKLNPFSSGGQPSPEPHLTEQNEEQSKEQSLPTAAKASSQESLMSIDATSSSSAESETVEPPLVTFHDSEARLLPACSNFHEKTKGKTKVTEDTNYGYEWFSSCFARNGSECPHGRLENTSRPTPRSFPNETPLDELKAWLHSPHKHLNGKTYDRSKRFLQDPRFSEEDLRTILFLAIETIQTLYAELEELVAYAERRPYLLRLGSVLEEARSGWLHSEPSHFDDVPRWGLEGDVLKAAENLDDLRDAVEDVKGDILKARKRFGEE